MWQPEASWRRLPGAGPGTVGVWEAWEGQQRVVVKRLAAPTWLDTPQQSTRHHPGYWRREADVTLSGLVSNSPGLVGAPVIRVEEDPDGITLVHQYVEAEELSGLFLARAVGRFATTAVPVSEWLARDQFCHRVRSVERSGGWGALARTPVADLANALWQRRSVIGGRLSALPQVLQHGDPVPSNLRARQGDDVVAVDWATVGVGPVGADLGYLSLSVREEFDPLLDAYLEAVEPGGLGCQAEEVAFAARATAVWTVFTRADRALAAAARGDGALAGKFRHPSVAPYLRAMQRQLPHVEHLLGT